MNTYASEDRFLDSLVARAIVRGGLLYQNDRQLDHMLQDFLATSPLPPEQRAQVAAAFIHGYVTTHPERVPTPAEEFLASLRKAFEPLRQSFARFGAAVHAASAALERIAPSIPPHLAAEIRHTQGGMTS